MVFVGIAVLISGVVLLSLKSSAKSATDPYTVSARPTPSMRLNPRSRAVSKQSEHSHDEHEDESEHGSPSRPKRDEVMWEVGSVSDDEDGGNKDGAEEGGKPQGLGEGPGHGHGERRGLLDEEEEVEGDGRYDSNESGPGPHVKDENEEFGEYEAVRRTSLDGGPSKD
jgi:hypothetical protein